MSEWDVSNSDGLPLTAMARLYSDHLAPCFLTGASVFLCSACAELGLGCAWAVTIIIDSPVGQQTKTSEIVIEKG